jgi:exopolysaccharide biosynthesis protein
MEIIREDKTSLTSIMDRGAIHVFTFGPGLVEDGNVVFDSSNSLYKGISGANPRTAIGMIDDLHYVFICADGRTSDSVGLTLSQLAEFMSSLGVKTGYNLDGGGSSTMYFMGRIVNKPSEGSERRVHDIVYIGY